MSAHEDFVAANEKYASTFDKGHLTLAQGATKKLIVVTCMDSRVDPATQLGLDLGEALIIRNAGGSAAGALQSLVIAQRIIGAREIAIIHHTDCGQFVFTNETIVEKIKSQTGGDPAVEEALSGMRFSNRYSNLDESVTGDVKFLKEHPLILKDVTITGWVYDVHTGKVKRIV